jgi:hypothetical protein
MPLNPARSAAHENGREATTGAAAELMDELAHMERQFAEARTNAHGTLCRMGLVTADIERALGRRAKADGLAGGIWDLRAGVGRAFAAFRPPPGGRR